MRYLRDELVRFKEISINIHNCLQCDDLDKLEELLNTRQEVMSRINCLDFKQEEFRDICQELEILKLEQSLNSLFNDKRTQLRRSHNKFSSNKNANKVYNKRQYIDSMFFNKKI